MKSNKKKLAFYYAIQQIKHTTKKNYRPSIKINIALNGLLLCVETSNALKINII